MRLRLKKRQWLYIDMLILFACIAIFAFSYLNNVILPEKVKPGIERSLSELTARTVAIERLRYNIFKGIVLNGVSFREGVGGRKRDLLRVDEVYFNCLILPLVRERKIVIPTVNITSPVVHIIKDRFGRWNAIDPPILHESRRGEISPENFAFLIYNVTIKDGSVTIKDEMSPEGLEASLDNLNCNAYITPFANIKIKASCDLSSPELPEKRRVNSYGSYDIKKGVLDIKNRVDGIDLKGLVPLVLPDLAKFAALENGVADIELDAVIEKKGLALKFSLDMKEAAITMDEIRGGGRIKLNGETILSKERPKKDQYKISLGMSKFFISGLSGYGELSDLEGTIEIIPDEARIEELRGSLGGLPVIFTGSSKNFDRPVTELTMESRAELSQLLAFAPDKVRANAERINLAGEGLLRAELYDKVFDGIPPKLSGRLQLLAASFKLPGLKEDIKDISGSFDFDDKSIFTDKIDATYDGHKYTFEGRLDGFGQPNIEASLVSDILGVNCKLVIVDDSNIRVDEAAISYGQTTLQCMGRISDLNDPRLNIYGQLDTSIKDIGKLFPGLQKIIADYRLDGAFGGEIFLDGPWRDPLAGELGLKVQSGWASVKGLALKDLTCNLNMKDKKVDIPKLGANFYGGTLLSSAQLDMNPPNPPYDLKVELEGVEMGGLIKDTPLSHWNTKGTLGGWLNLTGYGKNTQSIKGRAAVAITDGYLWESPLLSGLLDIMLVPGLGRITFKEASGNFRILNRYVITDDLSMQSDEAILRATGSSDFEGNINFDILASFHPDFLGSIGKFGPLAGLLMDETGRLLGQGKITGTLKKPTYKFRWMPLENLIEKGVRSLLKGGILSVVGY
ncbi:MAG: AsmA family protein [Candidatus Omnitrophica bacterium]|nr:AsmA family protein [Candidatus Omnitrophota bacterium]